MLTCFLLFYFCLFSGVIANICSQGKPVANAVFLQFSLIIDIYLLIVLSIFPFFSPIFLRISMISMKRSLFTYRLLCSIDLRRACKRYGHTWKIANWMNIWKFSSAWTFANNLFVFFFVFVSTKNKFSLSISMQPLEQLKILKWHRILTLHL